MQSSTDLIVHAKSGQVLVRNEVVEGVWPDAPTVDYQGTKYAVLPHHPYTQIKLRQAQLEIPAPILSQFDWASADGMKPFAVQKATAALATSHQRAYILNDLGCGKTRAALWSWYYLRKIGVAKKLLVVAPLSTLRFVWQHEVTVTLPNVKTSILHGTRKERHAALAKDADIYIINHDGLKVIDRELYRRNDIDTLILDELAVYRNNSDRSKHMRKFAQRFVWVWGMTGRPMPQSPVDVWAQCQILTPQNVPKFYSWARTALMQQVSQYKWVPKEGATETAFSWMKPAVRFSLDDVVELPEAVFRTIDVEMTEEQKQTYRHVANEYAAMVQDKRIVAANAGVALGKLLQIASGYVYTTKPDYAVVDSKPRQEQLLEIIDEASSKVIVFAPWRHLIAHLSDLLTKKKIDHAVVHGDVSDKNRGLIFNAFQNTSQYQVILAHPNTMSHGLTLTAAATMVWYAPVTSLDVYEQACARIRRPSQKNKQLYLHLQSTAVERKIYAMLRQKQKTQDRFLAMLRGVHLAEENNEPDTSTYATALETAG